MGDHVADKANLADGAHDLQGPLMAIHSSAF
jgi:hypothetical protein